VTIGRAMPVTCRSPSGEATWIDGRQEFAIRRGPIGNSYLFSLVPRAAMVAAAGLGNPFMLTVSMTTEANSTVRHIRLAVPRDIYRQLCHLAVERDLRVGEIVLEAAERLAREAAPLATGAAEDSE
jgi:hypothetical protein